MLKPLTMWITTNCGKFLKRWEYQTTLPASWETCTQIKKQQLEPNMEQQTGSKLRKKYVKAVYCYPAYLIYMQNAWVHAKSLQLYQLCNPMNCSPPGSSVHMILEARILEWLAWPPPGDLPDPETEPESLMPPALADGIFITSTSWEAPLCRMYHSKCWAGWITIESRLPGEISTTSDRQMIPL